MNNVTIFFHMRASNATHTYGITKKKLRSSPLLPLASFYSMAPALGAPSGPVVGNAIGILLRPRCPLPDRDAKDVLSLLKQ